MSYCVKRRLTGLLILILTASLDAEEVGGRWGTEKREREYYRVVSVPIPKGEVIEGGAFELMPDNRLAVGTRRGDIFFIKGVDEDKPRPQFHKFAEGLDEIFGLAHRKGALYVTHSAELTRVTDTNGDGKADRFETISDAWGYGNYHEYAFGSKFDPQGNLYVALGLSNSYHSRALFRGWAMKITPEGKSIPIASGLRSPGGIGPNEHGALFYIESQGPWNSSCSLKFLKPGGFMGHPVSFNWYKYAPHLKEPVKPESGTRIVTEKEKVKELVPYAVIFPYIRMGRSITGYVVDRTAGNSAKQVSNQTGGLVRGEQHRHLGGFHRAWLQARERALGRLAPHRLLAGQPLGYTIYGVPVVALHALFRGGNKNGCATVPAAQRTADKTMAVAVHPAALLGADLRTVAYQTRVNIQCGGLQQQRALDGIISAQLPGMKQIQIRQIGGHQLRIRKAGARVFTGVTGNHQRGLHRFDNGLIRGV